MYEGQIVGTAVRGSASPEALGLLMAGVVPGEIQPGASSSADKNGSATNALS
jgi:hypothetical protein